MEDMTAKKIFRKIPMFDYQAICLEVDNNPSSAAFLWTVSWLFKVSIQVLLKLGI